MNSASYQMDSTISILRDVAKSGEDRVLQVKKCMSSLARALRNAVISVEPLERLCDWSESLELGSTATGTCEGGKEIANEIRNDISVLRARCAFH